LDNNKTEKLKEGFSKRLLQVMLDKGFMSPKSPTKANTQKLADACGVSRQMAARYLNADAIPDIKVLNNISDWLLCDPWWLLYGNKKEDHRHPSKISQDIFKFIVAEMRLLIAGKCADANDFGFLFDNIINIYNNVTEIEADLESKKKSAIIMIDFIKHQYKFLAKA